MLKATVNGLQRLRRPEDVARIRGLTVSQVLPIPVKAAEPVAAETAVAEEVPVVDDAPAPAEETTDAEAENNPDA
jgi:hypothetical protein